MPDGTLLRGIPDGTPKADIMSKYQASQARLNAPDPTEGMSTLQKFGAGVGSQVMGRARSLGNAVGLVSDEDRAEVQQREAPLRKTGAAKAGGFVADMVMSAPFARLGMPGAVAAGGLLGATDPDGGNSNKERAVSGAIGMGLGGVGQKLGNWAGAKIKEKIANAALRKAQNAPRDAALAEGQKLGMVVPPATVNRSGTTWALESLAGKAATQQQAAVKNAPVMQNAMRDFLGLPKDAPMTVDTLSTLRKQAGAAYDEVKGLQSTMITDSEFLKVLDGLEGAAGSAGRSFPGIGKAKDVGAALAPLRQLNFKSGDAVDAVRALRESAKEAFANRQASVGRAQIGAAHAMEDLIERNIARQVGLGKTGKDYASQTLQRFRDARKVYAKTYAVENIINKATGNVKGSKAAQMIAKGVPVTGQLKTVANFASAFPKAVTEPADSSGINALRMMFGVEGALLGHPGALAAPALGHLTAGALTSKTGQRLLAQPSYKPSLKALKATRGLGKTLAPGYFQADGEEP